MNPFEELALRFTLAAAHLLWVGGLIWLGAFLADRFLLRSPSGRHAVHLAGLVLTLVALPLCFLLAEIPSLADARENVSAERAEADASGETVAIPSSDGTEVPKIPMATGDMRPMETGEVETVVAEREVIVEEAPTAVLPEFWRNVGRWIAGGYVLGLLLMTLRLLLGMAGTSRLRRRAEPVTTGAWSECLESIRQRLQTRGEVAMAWSREVAAPVVIGLVKPAILIPIALGSRLNPAQVEAVLAHELAHLRRRDHWALMVQRVAETILFFHPAVWWMSRRMDSLREEACDDLVVSAGCNPADYAEALVLCSECRLERGGWSVKFAEHLAVTGKTGSPLRQRILRLLGQGEQGSVRLGRAGWVFGLMLTLGVAMVWWFGGVLRNDDSEAPLSQAENQAFVDNLAGSLDVALHALMDGREAYYVIDAERGEIGVILDGERVSNGHFTLPEGFEYRIDYLSLDPERRDPDGEQVWFGKQRSLESPVILSIPRHRLTTDHYREEFVLQGKGNRGELSMRYDPSTSWSVTNGDYSGEGWRESPWNEHGPDSRSALVEGEEREELVAVWNGRRPTIELEEKKFGGGATKEDPFVAGWIAKVPEPMKDYRLELWMLILDGKKLKGTMSNSWGGGPTVAKWPKIRVSVFDDSDDEGRAGLRWSLERGNATGELFNRTGSLLPGGRFPDVLPFSLRTLSADEARPLLWIPGKEGNAVPPGILDIPITGAHFDSKGLLLVGKLIPQGTDSPGFRNEDFDPAWFDEFEQVAALDGEAKVAPTSSRFVGKLANVTGGESLQLFVRPGKVDDKGILSLVFEVKNLGAEAVRVVRPVFNGPGVGVLQFDEDGHQRGEPPFEAVDGQSARLSSIETIMPGEVVAMEKLQERFQQMVKERPELQVIVYANDPELPPGRVIAALQTARAAGVKDVRLSAGEALGEEQADADRGADGEGEEIPEEEAIIETCREHLRTLPASYRLSALANALPHGQMRGVQVLWQGNEALAFLAMEEGQDRIPHDDILWSFDLRKTDGRWRATSVGQIHNADEYSAIPMKFRSKHPDASGWGGSLPSQVSEKLLTTVHPDYRKILGKWSLVSIEAKGEVPDFEFHGIRGD